MEMNSVVRTQSVENLMNNLFYIRSFLFQTQIDMYAELVRTKSKEVIEM